MPERKHRKEQQLINVKLPEGGKHVIVYGLWDGKRKFMTLRTNEAGNAGPSSFA